jgi:NhaA family Na+:H+ antiporter
MADRPYPLESIFGRVLSPFEQFLRRTSAGGIVLVATTVVALALATLAGDATWRSIWERTFALSAGGRAELRLTWHHWINDGLMALFFLLVGLELKREILVGELASIRDAALPVIAAAGGMLVPAAIYLTLNAGSPHASGWGIPMATDIAFAVGILVLLGRRAPRNLIVFLTALAIADDLGAVLVIALFYTGQINREPLAIAAAIIALLALFNRGGVRHPLPYALAGAALWGALHASGLHATLTGIVLAVAIPSRPSRTPAQFEARLAELQAAFGEERKAEGPDDPIRNQRMASLAEAMERTARAMQSPLQRMEHALAPWVTFVAVPVFALTNAGIDLTKVAWSEALSSPVTLGVLLGLALGKFAGIALFSAFAVRLGLARLPAGVSWSQLLGAAWLGGIGFTMSLFIAQLAFADAAAVEQAKLGILLASATSAATGLVWLWFVAPARPRGT